MGIKAQGSDLIQRYVQEVRLHTGVPRQMRVQMYDHLQESQKRDIANAIKQSGLPPEEFSLVSHDGQWVGFIDESVPAIRHVAGYVIAFGETMREDRDACLSLLGRAASGDHHVLMKPGPDSSHWHDGFLSWAEALQRFQMWLSVVARETNRPEFIKALRLPETPAPSVASYKEPPAPAEGLDVEKLPIGWLLRHMSVGAVRWVVAGLIGLVVSAFSFGVWYSNRRELKPTEQALRLAVLPGELLISLDSVYRPLNQASTQVQVRALTGVAELSREAMLLSFESDSTNLRVSATLRLLSATPSNPVVRSDSGAQEVTLLFDVSGVVPEGAWNAGVPRGVRLPLGQATVRLYYRDMQNALDSTTLRVPVVLEKP